LSHNETSIVKIDHKNEISAKNWVGSTWVAKSQLCKKSTLLVKVNAKSQLWSTEKSTPGQHKKSTLVNEKVNAWSTQKVNGQHWSKSMVNARVDVAVACLGLTWCPGSVTRGKEEVWRVGARAGE
jgi:hypothetical protein